MSRSQTLLEHTIPTTASTMKPSNDSLSLDGAVGQSTHFLLIYYFFLSTIDFLILLKNLPPDTSSSFRVVAINSSSWWQIRYWGTQTEVVSSPRNKKVLVKLMKDAFHLENHSTAFACRKVGVITENVRRLMKCFWSIEYISVEEYF